MTLIRTSPRALFRALVPLMLFQIGLIVQAILLTQTYLPPPPLPNPDALLPLFVARVGLDAAALMLGHEMLRRLGVASRAGYAAMGAVAAVAIYAMVAVWARRYGVMLLIPHTGLQVTPLILPIVAGATAGFLYHQIAGRDWAAYRTVKADPAGTEDDAADQPPAESPVTAAFAGPIRVRSSFAAMTLASAMPALAVGVVTFTGFLLSTSLVGFAYAPDGQGWSYPGIGIVFAVALPLQMMAVTALVTAVPALVMVLAGHLIARALRAVTVPHYALVGIAVGLLLGFVPMVVNPTPLEFPGWSAPVIFAVLGAAMMALYRRFAGIEPAPLPEPVLAGDPRALVGEEHPSRRQHAVLLNG